ncbi:ABC-type transport system involved in resistance to organic solvent, auxiliary component [Labilithrix luteola]|uniref:ABC-type transport system involved in resistance to organic solvent, auxiliary component n=1 Tax=Labilithrix luteola TaxID=1391654 RepID=A0A0K1Q2F2_9BACT|nr:ABC transporter substrate-binding protein [Labilithrix luteola]AKU99564.1 ABC-type transport system involved in resistance to organic solvent, auxiliary component [Labilithrix luteola]
MRIRPLFAAAVFALSSLTIAGSATADVAGAQAFVEKEHGKIRKLVDANAPDEAITQSIDGMVDYDELAHRTLGKPCPATVVNCKNHWDELSADQQKEVTGLLRKLVEKNYHKNLTKTREYDITYRGAKDQGENLSKVRTEAKSKVKPRDPAVQVDYLIMAQNGGSYKVVDIVTEGSSMTKNYYDQFHRMLTTAGQGYPYLVKKLNDKISQPANAKASK